MHKTLEEMLEKLTPEELQEVEQEYQRLKSEYISSTKDKDISLAEAIEELKRTASKNTLGDDISWKELRDEGRKWI